MRVEKSLVEKKTSHMSDNDEEYKKKIAKEIDNKARGQIMV